jgi:hypothetical protein
MKKPADDLFQLIKSLTQAEKRYFKVHAGKQVKGHSNKYEKLFDAYDALPDDKPYDEAAFKRSLRGKSYGKNLAQEKQYLQESLMETLRAFHAEGSIDNQLYQLLAEEDIYRQKRLNNLREKTIEKAKEIARKYEKWEVLLMLLDRELGMNIELYADKAIAKNETISKDKDVLLSLINENTELLSISALTFLQFRLQSTKDGETLASLAESKVNSDYIAKYKIGKSFQTDLNYFKTMAMYSRMKFDFVANHNFCKLIFQLYEDKFPQFRTVNSVAYKIAIFNYLNSCHAIGDYTQFNILLNKIETIASRNSDEEGEEWQNVIHLKLLYFLNTNSYKEAIELEEQINLGLEKFIFKVNQARKLILYYNLATAFFMIKNWDKALEYFYFVSNDKSGVRLDLVAYTKFMELVVHYEKNNFEYLEYACRNANNFLKNIPEYAASDKKFIELINRMLKLEKAERNKLLESYQFSDKGILSKRKEIELWAKARGRVQ